MANEEIQLLNREDILKALHNSYTEKYVAAVIAEMFYTQMYDEEQIHKQKKMAAATPEEKQKIIDQGDPYRTEMETARENIKRNARMLACIQELLQDPEKIHDMGGVKEKRLDISGTS
jgi:hypothetical protein